MREAVDLHFRYGNQRVKKPVVLSDIEEIEWEKGSGGGETREISNIRSWEIEDEISSILYPLPGAVYFGLMEGNQDDDVYKGWDMVEIAHDLMGMVLVCVWKDGYDDVGLWVGWNQETFPDFFVGSLLLFLGFFSLVPPIWIPQCPPFLSRRENLELMQYWMISRTWFLEMELRD